VGYLRPVRHDGRRPGGLNDYDQQYGAQSSFSVLTWNGTKYLVTWTENFGSPETSVKGRSFDASGAPVGSEQTLFSAADDGSIPWLAAPFVNGSNYFAVVNRGIPGIDPFNIEEYANANVYGKVISP